MFARVDMQFRGVPVSENKTLCHPASVDSLSTSAGTEDHVSMGGFAARKALQVVRNVEKVTFCCRRVFLDTRSPSYIDPFSPVLHSFYFNCSCSDMRIST